MQQAIILTIVLFSGLLTGHRKNLLQRRLRDAVAALASAYAIDGPEYLELCKKLDPDPTDMEVRRNMAVTQPLLWMISPENVPLLR